MSDHSTTNSNDTHNHPDNHVVDSGETNHFISSRPRGRPYRSYRPPRRDREPRDPAQEARKIYVGNLPFKTTSDELRNHFSSIGSIERVMIARRLGRSLGFGFVVFENEESVPKAVSELANTTLSERTISVETTDREHTRKPRRVFKPRANSTDGQQNYNGDEGTTSEGDEQPKRAVSSSRPKPRGRYERKSTSTHRNNNNNNNNTDEERRFRRPRRRVSRKPISETGIPMSSTVYVRGFGHNVTEDMIREIFVNHDLTPVKIEMRVSRLNRNGGFALVELDNTDARDRAIEQVAGTELGGKSLAVYIAYAPAPRPSHNNNDTSTDSSVVSKCDDNNGNHPSEVAAEAAKAE